jgi:hypothetical protein
VAEDACAGVAGSKGDETGSRMARTVLGWDEPFREIAHAHSSATSSHRALHFYSDLDLFSM